MNLIWVVWIFTTDKNSYIWKLIKQNRVNRKVYAPENRPSQFTNHFKDTSFVLAFLNLLLNSLSLICKARTCFWYEYCSFFGQQNPFQCGNWRKPEMRIYFCVTSHFSMNWLNGTMLAQNIFCGCSRKLMLQNLGKVYRNT